MSAHIFVGRVNELQKLKNAWFKAKERKPQIINIVANTGVGKTRLAHAFYEWLSTDPTQGDGIAAEGYWPDELGIGRQRIVNPPLDCFSPFNLEHRTIPWLWWGMYWTDVAGEKEPALNRFGHYLELHLELIQAEKNFKKNFLSNSLELGMEEMISAAGEFIPGVGTFVNVSKFAKKLINSKKKQKDRQKGAAELYKKNANDYAANLIASISVTVNPLGSDKNAVPMVLFLDDIHFSEDYHQDTITMTFIGNLLSKAFADNWPLLVITTNWKTEWNYNKKNKVVGTKSWHNLIQHLEHTWKIDESIILLNLENIPTYELRQIILNTLPGLSIETQNTILSNIDNLRWMNELLIALKDNVDNFIHSDRTQTLSPFGEKRLKELLTSTGYLEVIRKRLEVDNMQDVRVILGAAAWHANDLEFISSLANSFSKPLINCQALSITDENNLLNINSVLQKALYPSAFIEGMKIDGTLAELIKFPERGYLEVAKSLFNQEMLPALTRELGLQIIAWLQFDYNTSPIWQKLESEEQKVFLKIAIKVLEALKPRLSTDQENELRVKEQTLKELMLEGVLDATTFNIKLTQIHQKMLQDSGTDHLPQAPLWMHVALSELINLYFEDGDARAWPLALRIADFNDVKKIFKLITFNAVRSLSEIWKDSNSCWGVAEELLSYSLLKYERLLVDTIEEKKLFQYIQTLKMISYLNLVQGKHKISKEYLSKAIRIIDKSKMQSEIILEKHRLLNSLADIEMVQMKNRLARSGYEKSLSIIQKYEKKIDTLVYLEHLIISIQSLAILDVKMCDFNSARAGFEQALQICEQILEKFSKKPKYQEYLCLSLTYLSDLDELSGQLEPARERYERSLKIWEQLIVTFGETPFRLRELTIPLERLAIFDRAEGKTDEARDKHNRIFDIHERILTVFGETPNRLKDLTFSLVHLADLAVDNGDFDEARLGYSRSIAIFKRLENEYPNNLMLFDGRLHVRNRLNDLDKTIKNKETLRTCYERCLKVCKQILAEKGETLQRLLDQTFLLEKLAELSSSSHKFEEAQSYQKRIFDIYERILTVFGETPGRLRCLYDQLTILANLELDKGDVEVARLFYTRSLEICEQLRENENNEWIDGISFNLLLERLARIYIDLGEFEKGLEYAARIKIFSEE